jgi:hypothetical protein
MKIIQVPTSDGAIWNQSLIYADIACVMKDNVPFAIDFLHEGPDIACLGLYDFLNQLSNNLNYDLSKITIYTSNMLEQHDKIKIKISPPIHLLDNAKEYFTPISKKNELSHFGIFIGRSNSSRLHLASYINKYHANKSIISYRLNLVDDFHISNIGIENIIKQHNTLDVLIEAQFLKNCPIVTHDNNFVVVDKNIKFNHAQQLLKNDKDSFIELYNNFFVEIVCETYFTGNTFFPTEKIWRPMLLKTPFIVQGPVNFLKNLKKIGFKTFSNYWDESYDEDAGILAITTIKQNIDRLSLLSSDDIASLYLDMQNILDHNCQLAMSLSNKDLDKIYEQK